MVKPQDSGQPRPDSPEAPPAPAHGEQRPPGETPAGASRGKGRRPEPANAEGNDPALARGRTFERKVDGTD